jgi:hypoxanthine-guanine phosphoribosyltransferase
MLSTRNSKSKKFDYRFEKMEEGNTSMNLKMDTSKVSGRIELIIEDIEDDGNKNNLT